MYLHISYQLGIILELIVSFERPLFKFSSALIFDRKEALMILGIIF